MVKHQGWWLATTLLLGMGCDAGVTMSDVPPAGDAGTAAPSDDAGPIAPPSPEPSPDPIPRPPAPSPDPDPVEPPPATCADRGGEPGVHWTSLSHDGLVRRAIVHVPEGYDPSAGTMLVLNFHGFTSADWQEALLTRMDREVDARGIIVVYPQGVATSWNAGACCGTAWADAVDDVGFVRALIEHLEAEYCIDARRIYATGMSNGGFLSHRLACELSDRVAAIAPVAGVLGVDPATCAPSRPVPVWHFHGTEDPLVPYEGGTPLVPELGAGVVFPSVADTMDHWARVNGCDEGTSTMWAEGDAVCVERVGCAAPVRLCTVHGGGHTWPGGLPIPFLGRTSSDLDATTAMLDFFETHPMP